VQLQSIHNRRCLFVRREPVEPDRKYSGVDQALAENEFAKILIRG